MYLREVRTCSCCNTAKTLSCFTPRRKDGGVIGYSSWCKECKALKAARDRVERGVKPKAIPLVSDSGKECLMCNEIKDFDQFSPSKRGRLGYSSYCRVCICRRLDNDDARAVKRFNTRAYREREGAMWNARHRVHQFNRRSNMKASEDGTVTKEFVSRLMDRENCCWCKNFVEKKDRTIEHIVELSQGGEHAASNLDMACFSCNSSRKGKI